MRLVIINNLPEAPSKEILISWMHGVAVSLNAPNVVATFVEADPATDPRRATTDTLGDWAPALRQFAHEHLSHAPCYAFDQTTPGVHKHIGAVSGFLNLSPHQAIMSVFDPISRIFNRVAIPTACLILFSRDCVYAPTFYTARHTGLYFKWATDTDSASLYTKFPA